MGKRDGKVNKSKHKYPAPFSIRLNEEERIELDRLSDGQPWGAYIKDVVLREKRKPRIRRPRPIKDRELLARLLGELGRSRIPQNINQLARAANSGSLPVTPDVHKALIEATQFIRFVRDRLVEALGLKAQGGDEPEEDVP